jgi:xylose isomerase
LKTSLNVSILGEGITRYLPTGHRPERAGETTAERVARAVAALGDVVDGYELYYPQVLNEANVDEVRRVLGEHDVYCVASGLHLDARFARGGLVAPTAELRAEALALLRAGINLAASVGARFSVWPGIEGYDYPFQAPYRESWARLLDGLADVAEHAASLGVRLLLEPKQSSPALHVHLGGVGIALFAIERLRRRGLDNIEVLLDFRHVRAAGDSLADTAALLAGEGALGHLHASSGVGALDEKKLVGATEFMETLELAVELRRAGYGQRGGRLGVDFYPASEDPEGAVRQAVAHWRFIEAVADRLDGPRLRAAQAEKDAVRAYELVYEALGAGPGTQ